VTAWHSGDIDVAGVRLHYARSGGDGPPLVFAHGVGDDGWCWTVVAEALAPAYDVVLVDARGHGRSAEPADGYGAPAQADDLRGLIGALELRRPVLVGHSMGAMTVLALAARAPELPRAIVLEDPPPWWMPRDPEADRATRAQMRADMAAMKRKTHRELCAEQHQVAPRWPDAEIVRWAEAKQRVSPQVTEIFDTAGGSGVDWSQAPGRVRCPVLLITGDPEQGALVTPEAVAALQRPVPALQSVFLPDAGHSVRHDQPERYLHTIKRFLDTLP
jgi:N-formylmaleamate deformylase